MKSLIISGLSSVLLSSFVSPVFASEIAVVSNIQNFTGSSIGPVTLVGLARQGFLKPQGIPSHLGLVHGVKSGKVDAKSLVESGIAAGRVSPDTLNNNTYLSQVKLALFQLDLD